MFDAKKSVHHSRTRCKRDAVYSKRCTVLELKGWHLKNMKTRVELRQSNVGMAQMITVHTGSHSSYPTSVYKYVDKKGLAAMLAINRSASVTLTLKSRADVIRIPKQGYQWPHKKNSCPPKFFKKKKMTEFQHLKADITELNCEWKCNNNAFQ